MPGTDRSLAYDLLLQSRSDSILVGASEQQMLMKDWANRFGSAPVLPTVPKARYGMPKKSEPGSLSEAIMMGYPGIRDGPWPGANWGCQEDDHCCVPRSISEYLERCRFLRSHSEGLLLPRDPPLLQKQTFPRAFSCGLMGGHLRRAVEELHDAMEDGRIAPRKPPPRRIPVKELVEGSDVEGKVVRITGKGLFLDIGSTREGLLWRRDLKGIPFKIEKDEVIAGLIIKKVNKKRGQITLSWRCTDQDITLEDMDLEETRNHIADWAGVDLSKAKTSELTQGHSAGTLTREPSGEFSDGGSSASSSRSGSSSPRGLGLGLRSLNVAKGPVGDQAARPEKAAKLATGRGRRGKKDGAFSAKGKAKGQGTPSLLGRSIATPQTRMDAAADQVKGKGKSLLRA
eukprot:gnl/MRDRNA2_/MRDRNA2_58348_c0_seq1.p1 gnl/MRDRNA2_/MRDRNA2_58348_c0~~gnl/MRDRNA2_/MRDRNA2_58348_c0_seq1.p1  ORF type:complete len:434 (+),score=69.76 gnl/MRDRNA2_/MRDRNA2_58348_c0_seq1:104-1303(+)